MRTTIPGYRNGVLRLAVITVMVAALLLVAAPGPARATGFTCDETGLDAALAVGGGPHTFACGAPTTITTSNEKVVTKDVILDGGGDLTISGADTHRVFSVAPGVAFGINNLTIEGGNSDYSGGGAIYAANGASLTVSGSTLSGNATFWEGGGIYAYSALVDVSDSRLTDNYAGNGGGGIYAWDSEVNVSRSEITDNTGSGIYTRMSTLAVADSTLSRNAGNYGGGIGVSLRSSASVTGSTLNDNYARFHGGGIDVDYTSGASITNSTLSGNRSSVGGGIFVISASSAYLNSSTVSDNFAGSGTATYVYSGVLRVQNSIVSGSCVTRLWATGSSSSGGHNVLSGCGIAPVPTDVNADPILGPLADNDGPAQTHALLPGSPAIDLVPSGVCSLTEDQRGVTRPQGSGCDAGAFELVQNQPPVASANGPYSASEGSPVSLDATGSTDPDGDLLGYEWDLDNDGEYDDASGPIVPVTFPDDGLYTVGLLVNDGVESDTDETTVTISNVAPIVDAPVVVPEPSDEGEEVTASATFSDPGFDDSPFTCVVDYGDGGALQPATVTGNTCTGSPHVYADDETYAIQVTVTDKDGDSGSNIVFHQVDNVAPDVSVDLGSQIVQYSDGIADVTITGTDVAADPLTATATGLPNGTSLTPGGCVTNGQVVCTWTVSGIADVSAGTYDVAVTVTDPDGGATMVVTTVAVEHEDALASFADTNEVAVAVASDGGNSGPFSLTVVVQELSPDLAVNTAYPGDISLADVSIALRPVGPGGSVSPTGACAETVTGTGYNGALTVTCPFDGVDVNAYTVDVTVDGGFYTGGNEDVLVVYDPSLGFTTGGGWFYWPGTDDKTNFGYTMKYNKKGNKVQGSFLLIRHLDDGTKYRVKSNALYGLALGGNDDMGWASFSGKAIYLQPGWEDPKGNHEFVVYVEDYGEPGTGVDRLWLETHNGDGDVIPALSMDRDAADNAETINGGNIVIPH